MTETSRPWAGQSVGDAGAYSHDQWAVAWASMMHAYAQQSDYGNRGPLIDSGDTPRVGLQVDADSPAAAAVVVGPGVALVDGTLYVNDADKTMSISANGSGNDRIDTVILRKSWSAQTVRLIVLEGTPAATPVPPSLTQTAGVTWEIPIADVYVSNGFSTIAQADITPRAEWAGAADGVYIKDIQNNSGAVLEHGNVVVWDSANDRSVTTTTTLNDQNIAGVWIGRTADGDYGRVSCKGVGWVRTTSALARGEGLVASSTAGEAEGSGTAYGNLGILLEASTAGNLALAFIDVTRPPGGQARYTYEVAASSGGPTYTAGADRTVEFNTESYDYDAIGALSSNQVTLGPGKYRMNVEVRIIGGSGVVVDLRLILYDVTNATTLLQGLTFTAGSQEHTTIPLSGVLVLEETIAIEVRIRVNATTQAPDPLNIGGLNEIYHTWDIERIG